jgi:protein gp37
VATKQGKDGIAWTDRTWSPVRGCSRVSAGCDNCYAMRQAHRFNTPSERSPYHGLTTIRRGKVDWAGVARFIPEQLGAPLRWRKPARVFVNSMSDLFHPSLSNEEIAAVFGVMAACPQHTFQVLTKQPKRAAEWFDWIGGAGWAERRCHSEAAKVTGRAIPHPPDCTWPLPNVHLGVSAENQKTWDERRSFVHGCQAAVHFASMEPLLGPIRLRGTGAIHLDWVIVGGESGAGARPCELGWIKGIVEQCEENAIPCFVKQLGARPCITEDAWRKMSHGMLPLLSPRSEHAMVKEAGLVQLAMKDRAGGDPAEWPEALRVRQFPEVRA